MKISKLIEQLNLKLEKHGDIEVTQTATMSTEGYSQNNTF